MFRSFFYDAFLRGNLFGASACFFSTEVRSMAASDSIFEVVERLDENIELSLGTAPREIYPLVLCFVSSKAREFVKAKWLKLSDIQGKVHHSFLGF